MVSDKGHAYNMNTKLENGRFLKIDELFAFISVDENGNEGIMAASAPNGMWHPLIGADTARVDSLRPVADEITARTGMRYEIRHFKKVVR